MQQLQPDDGRFRLHDRIRRTGARERRAHRGRRQERSVSGRTGVYDIEVSNQDGAAIAFFRGKSYRIKGHVLDVRRQARLAGAGGN